jgi:hypothetical protein
MAKITRADFRDLVRSAIKDAGLDEQAEMKNKDLDTIIAAVGDAAGEALRTKHDVGLIMHDHKGRIVPMCILKLAWKNGRKGYRKGQKYERRPSPISPDPHSHEDEVTLSDGSIVFEGKRQESKPDTAPKWGLKARPTIKLLDEVLPEAPKRKPK